MFNATLRSLALAMILCTTNSSFAQQICIDCTTLIPGTDIFPRVIPSGMKVCILASGNLQGDVALQGGELCNEGTLSSQNIVITEGTLDNYGIIDAEVLAATNGSIYNRSNSSAFIDSIAIEGTSIELENYGDFHTQIMAISKFGTGSDPTVFNQANFNADSIAIYGGLIHNDGNLIIDFDFGNHSGSSINSGFMSVGRDFGNDGDFHTDCIIPIGRDWGNTGNITGPMAGPNCGGFSVLGSSGNTGDFGVDGSYLDFCDSGAGFDGNTGNLGANVSYCLCTNNCQTVGLKTLTSHSHLDIELFPNPFEQNTSLYFENPSNEAFGFSIFDVQGRKLRQLFNIRDNLISIERGELGTGLYFFRLSKNGQAVALGKFQIN